MSNKRKPLPKTIKKDLPVMDKLLSGPSTSENVPSSEEEITLTRKEKEAKRRRERAKHQVRYDLPPGMKDRLTEIAEEYDVPPSHLAGLLLAFALESIDHGDIDPADYRVDTRSLKYKYGLTIPNWPDD